MNRLRVSLSIVLVLTVSMSIFASGPISRQNGARRAIKNEFRRLARQFAVALARPESRQILRPYLMQLEDTPLISIARELEAAYAGVEGLSERIEKLERRISKHNRIVLDKPLLRFRLASAESSQALESSLPLVTYDAMNNGSRVEAFNSSGSTVYLSSKVLPKEPVLIIDIESKLFLEAVSKRIEDEMPVTIDERKEEVFTSSTTLSRLLLTRYHMKDDMEIDWLKGDAEVMADVYPYYEDGSRGPKHVVVLASLKSSGKVYFPNTTLFVWGGSYAERVQIIFYEDDVFETETLDVVENIEPHREYLGIRGRRNNVTIDLTTIW
jgi:hypothetical protein